MNNPTVCVYVLSYVLKIFVFFETITCSQRDKRYLHCMRRYVYIFIFEIFFFYFLLDDSAAHFIGLKMMWILKVIIEDFWNLRNIHSARGLDCLICLMCVYLEESAVLHFTTILCLSNIHSRTQLRRKSLYHLYMYKHQSYRFIWIRFCAT